jgi:hypothetical protein
MSSSDPYHLVRDDIQASVRVARGEVEEGRDEERKRLFFSSSFSFFEGHR